jgi:predicted GTPase
VEKMAALLVENTQPFINIVLLGRTGRGKSSTGNSIIGSNVFLSKRGASAVTMKCEIHSCTRDDGVVVNVIDTPGLFDPGNQSFIFQICLFM